MEKFSVPILQAVVLGIVQGLTEFLPVSSSGHLILIPQIFKWTQHSLAFDTSLHLGTALALLIYFGKEVVVIPISFIKDLLQFKFSFKSYSKTSNFGLKLLIGCIPAFILGFLFEDKFESVFRDQSWVVLFLLLGSLLMWYAEKVLRGNSDVSYKKSILIGMFQSLALFPGVSRSGSTISGGMILGLKREEAALFSFMLSIPVVVGAGVYKGITSFGDLLSLSLPVLFSGIFFSFVTGMLAIKCMLSFVKTHTLKVFIIYRIILALGLVVLFR